MFRCSHLAASIVRKQCAQSFVNLPKPAVASWLPSRSFATSSHAMDLELPQPVYTPPPPKPTPPPTPGSTPEGTPAGTPPAGGAAPTPGTTPPTPTPPPPSTPPTPPPQQFAAATAPPIYSNQTTGPTINPATPPPPPRKKRVKKPEKAPEDPVVAEFNAFKNRLQLARLRGEAGEQEAEKELEQNVTNGLQDKNKRAVEIGLMEIYDTLFPLGFHSVWLYKLGKKYSGYEFIAKYLLKNKGKNWVLFVPRRQINLWQECAIDFLTTCDKHLVANEINVSDVLDVLTVYFIDTLERDKYTFLDDQIEKPTIRAVKDVVKFTVDTLSEEMAVKFYVRLVTEHPLIMQNLKPEELRDLLAETIARLNPENAAALKKDVRAAEAIQNMVEVKDLIDGTTTVRPPPAFTPPAPENAPPAVVEPAAGENQTPINPASS